MNVSQIRHSVEMYCGVTVQDDVIFSAVNESLNYIGDLADIQEEATVEVIDAGLWYDLPTTATGIINVTDSDGKSYKDWQSRMYQVKFNHADTYKVLIREMPNPVDDLDEEPGVHVLFQRPLMLFCRAYVKLMKDDGNQDGHKMMQQFGEEVNKAAMVLQMQRKR